MPFLKGKRDPKYFPEYFVKFSKKKKCREVLVRNSCDPSDLLKNPHHKH